MASTSGKLQAGVRQVDAAGRRWFEEWYRRDVVKRCLQPGASTAAIALECGLNANLVRKWISNARRHDRAVSAGGELVSWVPVAVPFESEPSKPETADRTERDADIIEIRIGDARILVGGGVALNRLVAVIQALR